MRYMTIGSGTAVPQKERSAPCHLVRAGRQRIVVDLGPGAIWGLNRHGDVDLRDVGLVLLTHLHMDHCADLAPLLFALRSRDLARLGPLTILGPRGLVNHYRDLKTVWEHRIDPAGFDLVVDEWGGGVLEWEGCVIAAAPTAHSVPNLAWRIDTRGARPGVVITGDGQPTPELVSLAGSSDHVLVAECAAAPGRIEEGHMNPAQAGELAQKCSSRKLVLCHINPGPGPGDLLREAAGHFDGEVLVAEDGMELEIG